MFWRKFDQLDITEEMKYLDIIYFRDTRWDESHLFHASFADGFDKVFIIFNEKFITKDSSFILFKWIG